MNISSINENQNAVWIHEEIGTKDSYDFTEFKAHNMSEKATQRIYGQ
jgi:hypothetical protein